MDYNKPIERLMDAIRNRRSVYPILKEYPDVINQRDEYGETPLIKSVLHDNENAVYELLYRGCSVIELDNDGLSALHHAVKSDKTSITQMLVSKSDVNGGLIKPLFYAVENNNKRIIDVLLYYGANLSIESKRDRHMMFIGAARCDHTGLVEKILDTDGFFDDIDVNDQDGRTCLMYACQNGNEHLARLFIEKGASINAVDEHGRNPYYYAACNGRKNILSLLADYPDLAKHFGAIFPAISNNKDDFELIQILLSDMEDLKSAKDSNGDNLIHLTVKLDIPQLVLLLIHLGVDRNCVNKQNKRPIDLAVDLKRIQCAVNLIQPNRDVLMEEIMENRMDNVESLLKTGINVNDIHIIFAANQAFNLKDKLLTMLLDKQVNRLKHFRLAINIMNEKLGEIQNELRCAVKLSIAAIVHDLLKIGSRDSIDEDGNGCMHLACLDGNLDIARFLLNYDFNHSEKNNAGETPLILAVKSRSPDLVVELLDHAFDSVDIHDNYGHNALHYATGDSEITKHLLNAGAGTSINNKNRNPILIEAVINQRTERTRNVLKTHPELLNQKDEKNLTALGYAISSYNLERTDLLLNQPNIDVNIQDDSGNTALHNLIYMCRPDLIKTALDKGGDVNIQNDKGQTVLHVACSQFGESVIDILLDANIQNINLQDKSGNTPLHLSTLDYDNKINIPKKLIERGADPMICNNDGLTPLYYACKKGNWSAVEYLADVTNEDLNNQDSDGNTPLHYSVARYSYEKSKILLRKDCNPLIQNKSGQTVLHISCENSYSGILTELLEFHIKSDINLQDIHGNTPLHYAVRHKYSQYGDLILKQPVNVNIRNVKGETAGHIACEMANDTIIKALLDNNLDLNCQNLEGNTMLHIASRLQSNTITKILLEYNADIYIVNGEGRTALHESCKEGAIYNVKTLLKKYKDVNIKDAQGKTPFDLAVEKKRRKIVDLFKTI